MNSTIKNAGLIQAQGRYGDTMLAHINPREAQVLKNMGGSGTINPATGLMEFSWWTKIRDAVQSAAVVVGNYFLPGSSLVTGQIVSKGSQEQLQSPLGQLALMASGAAGVSSGQLANYGKLAKGDISGFFNDASNTVSAGMKDVSTLWKAPTTTPAEAALTDAKQAGSITQKAAADAGVEAVKQTPSAGGGGLISAAKDAVTGAVKWAGENPVPAMMAAQGIGAMATASANQEAAKMQTDAAMQMQQRNLNANMAQGGWGGASTIQAADPSQATDIYGRYLYGPMAGQYAQGRQPTANAPAPRGLISAAKPN